jgi:hypothetical protein
MLMDVNEPIYLNLETVALLREAVEDAWFYVQPQRRPDLTRSALAERVLKAAAKGERDPERLRRAALGGLATLRNIDAESRWQTGCIPSPKAVSST